MTKRTNGRIDMPRNVEEVITLANKVYTKHTADGVASPLNAMASFDWSVTGPKIVDALDLHERAESLSRLSEALYKDRDILMNEIEGIVHASAAVLKGVHYTNVKKIGEWGFDVNDSSPVSNNNKKSES